MTRCNEEKYTCLDCGKDLCGSDGLIGGAWNRTDGNPTILNVVPGGVVPGKHLGYVCNGCHDKAFEGVDHA